MCTVTYVPTPDGAILTSNRDERPDRASVLPPAAHRIGNRMVIFPVDPRAGGTWMAMTGNNRAGVLLNGGFEKHVPALPYRQSRGIFLPEILSAASPEEHFQALFLDGIEPLISTFMTFSSKYSDSELLMANI